MKKDADPVPAAGRQSVQAVAERAPWILWGPKEIQQQSPAPFSLIQLCSSAINHTWLLPTGHLLLLWAVLDTHFVENLTMGSRRELYIVHYLLCPAERDPQGSDS